MRMYCGVGMIGAWTDGTGLAWVAFHFEHPPCFLSYSFPLPHHGLAFAVAARASSARPSSWTRAHCAPHPPPPLSRPPPPLHAGIVEGMALEVFRASPLLGAFAFASRARVRAAATRVRLCSLSYIPPQSPALALYTGMVERFALNLMPRAGAVRCRHILFFL